MSTSAIEGEPLNRDSIRPSVARRLGLPTAGMGTFGKLSAEQDSGGVKRKVNHEIQK